MVQLTMKTSLINLLFRCSLCRDRLRSATVISECLHRFCKACIAAHIEQHEHCPTCHTALVDPQRALKSDLTFQRLSYKLFPRNENEPCLTDETQINVCVNYWDVECVIRTGDSSASDLDTNGSTIYLQCRADTSLSSIETLLRGKYSLPSTWKVDLFYRTIRLDVGVERVIDVCRCFDLDIGKTRFSCATTMLDLRFLVSRHGYRAILERRRRRLKQPTNAIDSTLKVKICRTPSSTHDWYIPQSITTTELPDMVEPYGTNRKIDKHSLPTKSRKPRRRIRFIPTMVSIPPSIFDRLLTEQIFSSSKTVCKVPPYVPEVVSISDTSFSKLKGIFTDLPLDLSLK